MNDEFKKCLNDEGFKTLSKNLKVFGFRESTIDPDFAKALGSIVVNFQRIESIIIRFICKFSDPVKFSKDGKGNIKGFNQSGPTIILINKLSFKNLIPILGAVALRENYSDMDALKKLIKKANQLESIRNTLIHSTWNSGGGRTKRKINKPFVLETDTEQLSGTEINEISDMMCDVACCFQELLAKYTETLLKQGPK